MFVYSTFVKLRIKNSYLLYILDWLLFKYCRVFHLFSDIYKRSPNVNFLSVFLVESRFAILFSKERVQEKQQACFWENWKDFQAAIAKWHWQLVMEQRQGQQCILKRWRYCQTLELLRVS